MSDVQDVTAFSSISSDLQNLVRELESGVAHNILRADLSSAIGSLGKVLAVLHQRGLESVVSPDDLSATDAVTMIQYLMESHNINNFDLAMWVSRARASAKGALT